MAKEKRRYRDRVSYWVAYKLPRTVIYFALRRARDYAMAHFQDLGVGPDVPAFSQIVDIWRGKEVQRFDHQRWLACSHKCTSGYPDKCMNADCLYHVLNREDMKPSGWNPMTYETYDRLTMNEVRRTLTRLFQLYTKAAAALENDDQATLKELFTTKSNDLAFTGYKLLKQLEEERK